jgi:hypothetical protein|nr:MAG TPA: hypothetical protein [Caudoviricetes sp.]
MEQKTKICADGFVWLVVEHEQARKLYKADAISLYALYNDESEALIESEEKLEETIEKGLQTGIEVGFLSELSATNGRW